MNNIGNKYRDIRYTPLSTVLKKELDDIEDVLQEGIEQHDDFLQKDVHDKDGNNIIDEAETLRGLIAKIEELNSLIGVKDNIQNQLDALAARKPKLIKTIETIESEPNQMEFIFNRDIEDETTVELRVNSTVMHDEDYIVANNRIILRRPFQTSKIIDFVFYEVVMITE